MLENNIAYRDWVVVLEALCRKIDNLEATINQRFGLRETVISTPHTLMTKAEVCRYLGITSSTFHHKVTVGGLPTVKQGKHIYVYKDELDKWLETGRKTPVPLTDEEHNARLRKLLRRKE